MRIVILIILTTIIGACNINDKSSNLPPVYNNLRQDFGGKWTILSFSDSLVIEIENSDRINNNLDSIEYYSTIIGRNLIEKSKDNFKNVSIKYTSKKILSVFFAEKSGSISINLELINRYKERTIDDYLIIKKAIESTFLLDDNLQKSISIYEQIRNYENEYVFLAYAFIERVKGNIKYSDSIISRVSEENHTNHLLHQYIGMALFIQNDLDASLPNFKKAHLIKRDNLDYLESISTIFMKKNHLDSSIYYHTKMINIDNKNARILYSRAKCYFQNNQDTDGCRDIREILRINPDVVIPKNILDKCQIQK